MCGLFIATVGLLSRALGVIENLLHQNRLQDDVKSASLHGSYPSKFPDWDTAWREAQEVVWAIEAHINKVGAVHDGNPEAK